MKSIFLTLVLLFLNYVCIAQIEWFDPVSYSSSVIQGKNATDYQGNTYSVGCFSSYIYFEPNGGIPYYTIGGLDVYVKKIDSDGNFVWGKTFGGNLSDRAHSVIVDNQGDILITGYFEDTMDLDPSASGVFNVVSTGDRDVFFVKLTSDGDFVWGKTIGTTGADEGLIAELKPSGNYCFSGYYSSTYVDLDPGPGTAGQSSFDPTGSFFVELNPQGNYVRGFGLSSTNLTITGVSSAENNGVYVSGHFIGHMDIDPGPSSQFISSTGPCGNCSVGFIVKVDSLGVMDWYQTIGEGVQFGEVKGGEVKVSETGKIYAYGLYRDSLTFYSGGNVFELFPAYSGYHGYLIKFSPDGVIEWANSIDCEYIETGAMALQGDEVILTGGFRVKVDFDPSSIVVEMNNELFAQDGFIASYDTLTGSFNWVNVLTTEVNGFVMFENIAYDFQGSFYGSGDRNMEVDFDPSTGDFVVDGAYGAAFIVKYDQTLNVPVSENGDFSMDVFPNPTSDQLIVSLTSSDNYSIEMMNQFGQCILYLEDLSNNFGIDVSNLSKGMYILRVRNSEGFAVRKVVVN